jgi:S-DNA-T family DNA segregation ATPase FtsK/SpoIIIE
VLLIDGWSALEAELDQPGKLSLSADLARILVDGPGAGIRSVVAIDRPGALRPSLAAAVTQRLVLRLADPTEHRALGLPAPGAARPGRGATLPSGLAVQVALPDRDGDLAAAVARCVERWAGEPWAGDRGGRGPRPIGRLPGETPLRAVEPAADLRADPWFLPIGIGSRDLGPAGWHVHAGEHVLVLGPPRSGRTSALLAVARIVRRHRPDVAVVAVTGSRLAGDRVPVDARVPCERLEELDAWVSRGPLVVLVDDAERVDDPLARLAALADAHLPDVLVVAAARADAVRSQYGSWVRQLRSSRLGLLLQPDPETDGDVFGVRLPRHAPVRFGPGRGYLLDGGGLDIVQVASVDDAEPAAAA